jgi:hypothetical protein
MENHTPISREELVNLLTTILTLNLDLNTPRSTFRRVLNNQNSQISVQIGRNNKIDLNFESLFQIYSATIENNGLYNKQICLNVLPTITRNHGCTVHVVGMIIVKIGIMEVINDRNYRIVI